MAFIPRLSDDSPTPLLSTKWYTTDNWYYRSRLSPPYVTGNCTWYAYGRFNEIRQTISPPMSTRTAKHWWNDTPTQQFVRGPTPALGAVICWANLNGQAPNSPGHVAVVEAIHENGDITVSESGYPSIYFRTVRLTQASGYTADWMHTTSRQYQTQGFIYQPNTVSWEWIAEPGYVLFQKESAEAYNNALIIYSTMFSYGWTLNAVCGLLGSIDVEGCYNPWLWENGNALTYNQALADQSHNHGYGLVQWTPSSHYIGNSVAMESPHYAPHCSDVMGSKNDGYAQLYAINNQEGQYSNQRKWYGRSYPDINYDQYKASTAEPEYLASVWMVNYEYPGHQPASDPGFERRRQAAARYWYGKLQGVSPTPGPVPPGPNARRGMPYWFYLKPNKLIY